MLLLCSFPGCRRHLTAYCHCLGDTVQPVGSADISSSVSVVRLDSSDSVSGSVTLILPRFRCQKAGEKDFRRLRGCRAKLIIFFPPSSLGSLALVVRGFPSLAMVRPRGVGATGGLNLPSFTLFPRQPWPPTLPGTWLRSGGPIPSAPRRWALKGSERVLRGAPSSAAFPCRRTSSGRAALAPSGSFRARDLSCHT